MAVLPVTGKFRLNGLWSNSMTDYDVFDLMAEIGDELELLYMAYGPDSQPFRWLVEFQHHLMTKQALKAVVAPQDEEEEKQ